MGKIKVTMIDVKVLPSITVKKQDLDGRMDSFIIFERF